MHELAYITCVTSTTTCHHHHQSEERGALWISFGETLHKELGLTSGFHFSRQGMPAVEARLLLTVILNEHRMSCFSLLNDGPKSSVLSVSSNLPCRCCRTCIAAAIEKKLLLSRRHAKNVNIIGLFITSNQLRYNRTLWCLRACTAFLSRHWLMDLKYSCVISKILSMK